MANRHLIRFVFPTILCVLAPALVAMAQEDDRPAPEPPTSTGSSEETAGEPVRFPDTEGSSSSNSGNSYRPSDTVDPEEEAHLERRPIPDGKMNLALDEVSISDLIPWIAEVTGKIVMPLGLEGSGIGLGTGGGKITLIVDEPIEKREALEMIFSALRMNKIAVIERPDVIILTKLEITQITNEMSDIPVLDSAIDVRNRMDRGTIVLKIFNVERTDAVEISEKLADMKPDYAEVWVDEMSNQIIVLGDIGLCQQYDKIIRELDQKWLNRKLHTFRLKWADANEVSTNILDIFEEGTATASARSRSSSNTSRSNTQQRGNTRTTSSTTSSGVELRLSVNVQQNAVTVQCEPEVMEEIAMLIHTEWDVPRSPGTSRLFVLKYTDPLKVKTLLEEVLGESTGSASQARGGQNAQRANATQAISGIYSIDAYPDKNALLVLAKTVESFDFIQTIINELDQPSSVGVPRIIPLKYARAVELAEELNVLLSKPGANVSIPRPEAGLSGEGFESPSGSTSGGSSTDSSGSQDLSFPWQRGSESDDQSPESSLIGKVRIVPIVRQNALAILSPASYIEPMVELIESFDIPRRQVLLSATIVEVDITDQWNLGAKWGNNPQASTNVNGQFFGGGLFDAAAAGTAGAAGGFAFGITDFLDNLLDGTTSSTLNVSAFDVQVILEALAQVTNTRIIQEPRVFTADNEEAIFFSGREVPIPVSNTTDLSGGNSLNTQIEYRDVGVFLNVRPRITQEGTVDLEISLQLSDSVGSVTVGQISGEVFSRKQVNSHVIVLDGQTVVLGGLLKETEKQIRQKIPLLGDIPIIGELFKYNDESLERQELLAFITPTVVHRPLDNYENYNREDLIRLEEVAQPLADQVVGRSWFSEGELQLNISERITASKNAEEARRRVEEEDVQLPDQMDQPEIDNIDDIKPRKQPE